MAKLKHMLKKAAKYLPALVGAVGGTLVGGPAGGMVGSTLGGTLAHGKKNKMKGALRGLAIGTGYNALAPMAFPSIASLGGGTPSASSFLGKATGFGGPSLLNQLGVSSAPAMGGGLGLFGNAGNSGLLNNLIPGGATKSLFGQGLSKLGGGSRAKAGTQEQQYSKPYEFSASPFAAHEGAPYDYQSPYQNEKAQDDKNSKIQTILSSASSSALDRLLQLLQALEEGNIQHKNSRPVNFKSGGYVHGDAGGQDDNVSTKMEPGSYVMDGTTVSLYGDGNSLNGGKKFEKMEKRFESSGITRELGKSFRSRAVGTGNNSVKMIDAKVSPGEYIIKKRVVDKIGGGNNNRGAKVLDKFRNDLRKDKGVKKFLPPKSKPIDHYVSKGRVR